MTPSTKTSFDIVVKQVSDHHVILVDPTGAVDPQLCRVTQSRVLVSSFLNLAADKLQTVADSGKLEWAPGTWTITVEKTA